MPNFLENCSVCLSNNAVLIGVSGTDTNQVKWSSKLYLCVPEVDWDDSCCICLNCIEQLETAYIFYHLCVQSYEVRKQQSSLVVKTEETSLDSREELSCTDNICVNETKIGSSSSIELLNEEIKNQKSEVSAVEKGSFKKCVDSNEEALKTEEYYNDVEENEFEKKPETRKSKYPKKCDHCCKYFNRKQHLDTHVRRYHTLEKPYSCDQCQEKFTTSHNLKIHKNRHSNNRPFICSFCGKAFGTSNCLYNHKKIHLNKRQYKCTVCEKSFNTTSILRAHKICVHTDSKLWKYPCTFCEKRFPMKSGLTAHVRRHTGEKNFVCHICGKGFSDKIVLLKHFPSHTDERLFKCHVCAKEYKAKQALTVHLKREHDLGTAKLPKPARKKYPCNLCSKAFVTGTKLEKHVRSHTGERPFACNICKKTFTDGWYLKTHLKGKHGQDGISDNCDYALESR